LNNMTSAGSSWISAALALRCQVSFVQNTGGSLVESQSKHLASRSSSKLEGKPKVVERELV